MIITVAAITPDTIPAMARSSIPSDAGGEVVKTGIREVVAEGEELDVEEGVVEEGVVEEVVDVEVADVEVADEEDVSEVTDGTRRI